jgi:hypothetical protein
VLTGSRVGRALFRSIAGALGLELAHGGGFLHGPEDGGERTVVLLEHAEVGATQDVGDEGVLEALDAREKVGGGVVLGHGWSSQ